MSSIGSISKININAPSNNCGFAWHVYICVNEIGWHATYDRWDSGVSGGAGSSVEVNLANMNIPTGDGYDFFVYVSVTGGCDVIAMQRFNYSPTGDSASYTISGSTLTPHLVGDYNGRALTGSY